MGLFGGLIKDSPATFAINAVRAQKGRMAKGKTRRQTSRTVDAYEYEPTYHVAKRFGYYLVIAGVVMPLGGFYVSALVLVALGVVMLRLGEYLKKRG